MAKTKAKAFTTYRKTLFRKTLLRKQQEMIDTYSRDRAAGAETTDDGIQDLADKAASAYSKELNFSLSDSDRETLVRIEEALERMKGGEFGACTNCSTRIGDKRLKAIPWTAFCIDCAELEENGMLLD